jgi:hypothetical protein
VLRAAGETESTQENIQDWLDLDEGDPGFQLMTRRNCCNDIFFYFHQHCITITFSIYLFSISSFKAIFASLIWFVTQCG